MAIADTGAALAVYVNGTSIPRWRMFDGANWSAEDAIATSVPVGGLAEWIELAHHPTLQEVGLAYSDDNQGLFGAKWTGAWTQVDDLAMGALNIHEMQCFDVAYESVTGDLLVQWGQDQAVNEETRVAIWPGGTGGFLPSRH